MPAHRYSIVSTSHRPYMLLTKCRGNLLGTVRRSLYVSLQHSMITKLSWQEMTRGGMGKWYIITSKDFEVILSIHWSYCQPHPLSQKRLRTLPSSWIHLSAVSLDVGKPSLLASSHLESQRVNRIDLTRNTILAKQLLRFASSTLFPLKTGPP